MQKEMDKIMEIANNIQSFPSISAVSTSIGKYSGSAMSSAKEIKKKQIQFHFSIFDKKAIFDLIFVNLTG
jgi:hypothetical protein